MKYVKGLALAACASVALLALFGASSASATQLTCTEPAGTKVFCPVGAEIHSEAEGSVVLDPPFGKIECGEATGFGSLTEAGSSTTTPSGTPALTTLGKCNATVTVLQKGTLEVHTRNASADNNGLFTSTGTEVTVEFIGTHCIFKTNGTTVGTLTGSSTTKKTATLDIEATIPRTGGRSGAFCGATAALTGSLIVTKPDWLDID
ncbi:MAG TPA: hypothetical protein VFX44_07660 [Solirubrobacterales bacterium]|nr:hypothetical protein [Solirubrobacterales bacterium]